MSLRTDNDELVQHLKRLPDFPLKPESKNKILKELVRMEQAIKPGNMRRVSMQRILGTALASVAGLALFAAGIMGFGHLGAQHSKGVSPNISTGSKPQTPLHAIQPTYFGYRIPFRPMIPRDMASGYKLTNSEISMTFQNGKVQFNNYQASYTKGKTPTSGRIEFPPILIYESIGGSVTQYQPIVNQQVQWTKLAQTNNQTYYSTNTPGTNAVGFVKNDVIYVINSEANIPQSKLLKYAESITKVAPIQALDIAAIGYKNALDNISFDPFLPTQMSSTFNLSSISSDVMKTTNGTTQSISVVYFKKSDQRKVVMLTEAPLDNANNQAVFSSVRGYAPTWKDYKRGLEFRLFGNTSSVEFHRVLNLFRSSN